MTFAASGVLHRWTVRAAWYEDLRLAIRRAFTMALRPRPVKWCMNDHRVTHDHQLASRNSGATFWSSGTAWTPLSDSTLR
jgi:hypothetical protein